MTKKEITVSHKILVRKFVKEYASRRVLLTCKRNMQILISIMLFDYRIVQSKVELIIFNIKVPVKPSYKITILGG
jgi:hypothetical protein